MDLRHLLNQRRKNKNKYYRHGWACPPPPPPGPPPRPPSPPSGPPRSPSPCSSGHGFGSRYSSHSRSRYNTPMFRNVGNNDCSRFARETREDIRDLQVKVAKLEEKQQDLHRQFTKRNLVMSGADVPRQEAGEDCTKIFIDTIFRVYNVNVKRSAIAQCHRLGSGIIAEFVYRGEGSSFRKVLDAVRESRENRRHDDLAQVFVTMQRSREDRSINAKCRDLKKHKLIQSYDRDEVSGKFRIKYHDEGWKVVQNLRHLDLLIENLQ